MEGSIDGQKLGRDNGKFVEISEGIFVETMPDGFTVLAANEDCGGGVGELVNTADGREVEGKVGGFEVDEILGKGVGNIVVVVISDDVGKILGWRVLDITGN